MHIIIIYYPLLWPYACQASQLEFWRLPHKMWMIMHGIICALTAWWVLWTTSGPLDVCGSTSDPIHFMCLFVSSIHYLVIPRGPLGMLMHLCRPRPGCRSRPKTMLQVVDKHSVILITFMLRNITVVSKHTTCWFRNITCIPPNKLNKSFVRVAPGTNCKHSHRSQESYGPVSISTTNLTTPMTHFCLVVTCVLRHPSSWNIMFKCVRTCLNQNMFPNSIGYMKHGVVCNENVVLVLLCWHVFISALKIAMSIASFVNLLIFLCLVNVCIDMFASFRDVARFFFSRCWLATCATCDTSSDASRRMTNGDNKCSDAAAADAIRRMWKVLWDPYD